MSQVKILTGLSLLLILAFCIAGNVLPGRFCSESDDPVVEPAGAYRYQELHPSCVPDGGDMKRLISPFASFFAPSELFAADGGAYSPAEKRLVRAEPSKYSDAPAAHGGVGVLKYMAVFDHTAFETNWLFIHRGILMPRSGIGEHIHRTMEEMFTILDGTAQFTVNGRTAQLPGGSMVLCGKGQSHAIYNNTDRPVEWMNLAVGTIKDTYDAIDYGDSRVGAKLESPAPFAAGYIDDRLIQWVEKAHDGRGKLGFRRIYSHESFATNWGFIDHCILPPGSSIGYHRHDWMEECYMVIKGRGRAALDGKTFDVQAGDFILNRLHGDHGIYNSGSEDMVLINMCVSLEKGKFDATNHGEDLSGW